MSKEELKEFIQNIPDSAGIYQYFGSNQKILYVGKAKSLKKRVKSYFKFSGGLQPANNLSSRIKSLISQVVKINYILVDNEQEALILENSLIKQLRPKYNILLRDDKTYPYISISSDSDFPRFKISREIRKDGKSKYYGPFTSGHNEILKSIYEFLPLVQRDGCLSSKDPCFYHQIKRCEAPCTNKISKESYKKLINLGERYIKNRNLIIEKLKGKIATLSEQMRYEEAIEIRDRVSKLENIHSSNSTLDFANNTSLDLLFIHENTIMKMFVRGGKVISSSISDINNSGLNLSEEMEEAYTRAIIGHYGNNHHSLAKEIIIPINMGSEKESIEYYLESKIGHKIVINRPLKGKKIKLFDMALKNIIDYKNRKSDDLELKIKDLFKLDKSPLRVEIFDTSHIQGEFNVGAMVVFENGSFDKSSYRKYKLESKDEYAQMTEMLQRRLSNIDKDPIADLWVIDGGKAQLALATELVKSIGVNLDIIAISKEKSNKKTRRAKGSAKDIIHTADDEFNLLGTDKRLQFIQRLRDEAHRFVITYHKSIRSKGAIDSKLLSISGVSEAKIKKLISHLGSFENIKNSSLEELEVILDKKTALSIYKYYKK